MSVSGINWVRVAVFVAILMAVSGSLGFLVYKYLSVNDALPARAESQNLAQIQQQLTGIEKRLEELEKPRKAQSIKPPTDVKRQETEVPSQAVIPRASRPQYQVSPASALQPQPVTAQPPASDPASAAAIEKLQQRVGTLQEQTNSNQEAWQATTNRLADVAGELGTQHGQIIQNQDELRQFLTRAEHHAFTFELRRGSTSQPVGPVRLSLQTSNQKSKRYTLCVYVQDSCVQVKDRVLYEVVQLAVSRDSAPLELIATKVERDGIVGYIEVPRANPDH